MSPRKQPGLRLNLRLVRVQAEYAGSRTVQHPRTHQQKRKRIIASVPGAFVYTSQRAQPLFDLQITTSVVGKAREHVLDLHHERSSLDLRPAAYASSGEIQVKRAHHIDSVTVFKQPELRPD